MPNLVMSKTLTVVGSVLIFASIFALLATLISPKNTSSAIGEVPVQMAIVPSINPNFEEYPGEFLRFPRPDKRRLSVVVEGPGKIHVNQSRPVKMIMQRSYVAPAETQGLARLYEPPEFNLSGAGLDIEPKDWISVAPDGSALWSVTGSKPGTWELVINSRQRPTDASALISALRQHPKGHQYIKLLESLPTLTEQIYYPAGQSLTIEVEQAWIEYAKIGGSAFIAFMGSLLTLPGILAYLKEREKAKRVLTLID